MPKSDAKRRADNKYNLAHYTVLGCKKACKDAGTTPNAVFREAVEKFMKDLERDM